MILKNGKRLDGMGDSLPIGSIIEYNGTDIPDGWELVAGTESGERNYIQCELTDRLNIPDTNYVLVPFNNNLIMGSAFTYDTTTNEVVIDSTSDIDKVKLHFHSILSAGGEQPVTCFEVLVYKNDEIVLIANESMELGTSRTAVSVDRIVECVPGDRFRVEIKSYDNIFILLNTYGRTVFSIEEMSNNVVIGDTETRELNTITAYSSTNVDLTAGNNIVFDTASITGSKFTLENGQIKIGAGVSKIRVSGQIWYWSNNTTRQWFTLNQNETVVNQMISYNTNYETMAFSSKIIDVNEGDVFYFKLHNTEGSGGIIVNNGASPKTMTFITIEEVTDVVNSDIDIQERQTSSITATYNPTVAGTTGNWKVPETDVATTYPLNDVVSQTGDGLTLDTTTGNIIVGKNISTVMVFNKVTYFSTETRMCASYILHNGNVMAQNTFGAIADIFMNINNSVLLNVKEGDTISLSFYGKQGNEVGRNKNSNLTVIEIPDTNIIKESSQLNLITDGDPVKAGYKIDGKDVYVKRIFVPSLPNNALLEVDSGVPNTYEIEHYVGTVINSNKYTLILPSEGTNYMRAGFDRGTSNYKLQITTNSDRTTWKGYFNIYYY